MKFSGISLVWALVCLGDFTCLLVVMLFDDKDPWGKSGKGLRDGLGEEFKKFFSSIKKKDPNDNMNFGGFLGDNGGLVIFVLLILLSGAYFASGFYTVAPDEEAVELVFGRFSEVLGSGFRYNFPPPIGKAIKVKTKRVNREVISGAPEGDNRPESENVMLTGDENMVGVDFEVQWKVDNIYNYLFKVEDPPGAVVRAVAESAVRDVIGSNVMSFVIQGRGRTKIASDVQGIIQTVLDSYTSGIRVLSVQMKRIDPPYKVIDSFRDVQSARADKERMINEAYAYSNTVLPKAKAEAFSQIEKAKALSAKIINNAEGDTKRFLSVASEFNKDPVNMKKRLYIESMENTLFGKEKLVISGDASSVLPHLFASKIIEKSGGVK